MDDFKFCQNKLSQYKIGGPSKPFIDQNLQLQLPDQDSYVGFSFPFQNPIYSHYVGSSPINSTSSQINEAELYRAMKEAEISYEGWKQIQQRLIETAKVYHNE